jgi:hypothetical protein
MGRVDKHSHFEEKSIWSPVLCVNPKPVKKEGTALLEK